MQPFGNAIFQLSEEYLDLANYRNWLEGQANREEIVLEPIQPEEPAARGDDTLSDVVTDPDIGLTPEQQDTVTGLILDVFGIGM